MIFNLVPKEKKKENVREHTICLNIKLLYIQIKQWIKYLHLLGGYKFENELCLFEWHISEI